MDDSLSLAFFAAPSFNIEGKMGWIQMVMFSNRLRSIQFPDFIPGFDVGNRIGTA
jgi:hypothetical protein